MIYTHSMHPIILPSEQYHNIIYLTTVMLKRRARYHIDRAKGCQNKTSVDRDTTIPENTRKTENVDVSSEGRQEESSGDSSVIIHLYAFSYP
jgi:hypothetical protein